VSPEPAPLQVLPKYSVNVTEPVGLLLPLPVTLAVSVTVAFSPSGVPTIGAPPEFTTVLVQL
jgi:hypothetical protein